jgi:hypothetical protein
MIKMIVYIACTLVLAGMLLSGCGDWTDWPKEQAKRVQILGEPVDETAVRDAIVRVLGGSDMHRFAIWFTDKPVERDDGEQLGGMASLCTTDEDIRVYLPPGTVCVFDTSLVHELMHRYDRYALGRTCSSIRLDPHPAWMFGKCGSGGMVKEINDEMRRRHCDSYKPSPDREC